MTLLDLVRNLGMSEHWSNYAHHALTLTVCACGLLCGGTGGTGVPRLGAMIAVFALMESVAPFYQVGRGSTSSWTGTAPCRTVHTMASSALAGVASPGAVHRI
eukprot:COSAG01_NODE_1005_length_12174_cov_40.917267_2_plen_103_part_00